MLNLEPFQARLANAKSLPWKTGWDEDCEEYYLEDSTGRPLAVGIAGEIVNCLEHYPVDLRVLVAEVERLQNKNELLKKQVEIISEQRKKEIDCLNMLIEFWRERAGEFA